MANGPETAGVLGMRSPRETLEVQAGTNRSTTVACVQPRRLSGQGRQIAAVWVGGSLRASRARARRARDIVMDRAHGTRRRERAIRPVSGGLIEIKAIRAHMIHVGDDGRTVAEENPRARQTKLGPRAFRRRAQWIGSAVSGTATGCGASEKLHVQAGR